MRNSFQVKLKIGGNGKRGLDIEDHSGRALKKESQNYAAFGGLLQGNHLGLEIPFGELFNYKFNFFNG